ncbi:MAG: delta-60 repeat domain-containing protein [Flavobacteriales bacterium]|nr:delta-60 repeat domain-containing protein [Flavobacteriales bacterium]
MKQALLLSSFLAFSTALHAQVPIIDYGFLVEDPSVLVNNVLVQPDGKILVGGVFFNYGGSGHDHLVRLHSDGTIDPTFNPGGVGPGNAVEDMVLMPDGRILMLAISSPTTGPIPSSSRAYSPMAHWTPRSACSPAPSTAPCGPLSCTTTTR